MPCIPLAQRQGFPVGLGVVRGQRVQQPAFALAGTRGRGHERVETVGGARWATRPLMPRKPCQPTANRHMLCIPLASTQTGVPHRAGGGTGPKGAAAGIRPGPVSGARWATRPLMPRKPCQPTVNPPMLPLARTFGVGLGVARGQRCSSRHSVSAHLGVRGAVDDEAVDAVVERDVVGQVDPALVLLVARDVDAAGGGRSTTHGWWSIRFRLLASTHRRTTHPRVALGACRQGTKIKQDTLATRDAP